MPEDLSREEEQRGTRRVMVLSAITGAILLVGLLLVFLVVWLFTGPTDIPG